MRPFSLRKSAILLTTALLTACLATTAYATESALAFNDVPQDSQYYSPKILNTTQRFRPRTSRGL